MIMNPKNTIKIGDNIVGEKQPTYFIADIAANHDGSLERAKKLIKLAKENGADAAKFQHHNVDKYVSDYGFKDLGGKFSHQADWNKSIFEVYKDAEVPFDWTDELKKFCDEIGIDFFTTPYDLKMVDYVDDFVPAYKIGSGDVAWEAMLKKIASKGKPVLFSTGAATIQEVVNAVNVLKSINEDLLIMQCNTNYTGSIENFKYINLNVLKTYKTLFPDVILGLSDHTPGLETTLGAVALGAKAIEKHFTDDTSREGPDHPFSMDPKSWQQMVKSTRYLEAAMGSKLKKVEENEQETVVLQRRAIRVTTNIEKGKILTRNQLEFQRPCPEDAIDINKVDQLIDKELQKRINEGDYLRLEHFDWSKKDG